MTDINVNYQTALRSKYRWNSCVGSVSLEDLWDFALGELDDVAQRVNKKLKEVEETSFLPSKTGGRQRTARVLQNKLDIVKHIIETLVAEKEFRENSALKAEKKRQLLDILHTKKTEELKGLSVEDLEKQISEL